MITALFYTPTDGTNKLLNADVSSPYTIYIQEYIKTKFIYPIHRSISIESSTVNKFRLFLYNCGWLKDQNKMIIDKGELDKFYVFLVNDMMEYDIKIVNINPDADSTKERKIDIIRITESHLYDSDLNIGKVVSLSNMINRWVKTDILGEGMSYKFEEIPHILPVYLDIRDHDTGLNKRYVNIMEGIHFPDNGDKYQSMLIWEIHSMICQTENNDCYTIVFDHNDNMMAFSDNRIPSNWLIDATNVAAVKSVMREVRFVFYTLQ
jgi:hypothetical protein